MKIAKIDYKHITSIIMENKENGWVVLTNSHGRTKKAFIIDYSFARTRKESISLFCSGSGCTWAYWRRKYNYRCEKAQRIISVICS